MKTKQFQIQTILRNLVLILILSLSNKLICNKTRENLFNKISQSICSLSNDDFKQYLNSGDFKGFFTYDEFWEFFEHARSQFPEYFSKKKTIGHTYQEKEMHGFFIGKHKGEDEDFDKNKNIIFISALHHSREPLTISMIIFIMFKIIKDLGLCKNNINEEVQYKWKLFFKHNTFFIVPLVNIDSYNFITDNWKTTNSHEVMQIRKNRNVSKECSIYEGGVDLNRNYGFKWGLDDSGSSGNPCDEDYRGEAPFSEPETQAVRDFVQNHPRIVTAVNNHSYGNCWIYPYNFINDTENELLEKKKPKFYKFYQEFTAEMEGAQNVATFGNNAKTINYETNGEAGDWMLEKQNIIDLDVELGNLDSKSDSFYPPRDQIHSICEYNYNVYEAFFWKHNIDVVMHNIQRNKKNKTITVVVFNSSISTLFDFDAKVYLLSRIKKERLLKTENEDKITQNNSPNRLLKSNNINEDDYSVKYAFEDTCNMNASDLKEMQGNNFKGEFHGRTYLKLEFQFESKRILQRVNYMQIDFETENNSVDSFLIPLELGYYDIAKHLIKIHDILQNIKRPKKSERHLLGQKKKILYKLLN
jgi:hypothetical protein